ncbi:MAG TPA: SDR family NAD(P)-dependent oxidoreductase [Pseudacidobacterium sp.]|nr:SDR family NAD(P)-dependent oxidoreductase [Pseudacidobacterium sp.]
MEKFARYPSLNGKVVLITGGGTGIGASLVEHFAHQGAKVSFLDVAEEASKEWVSRIGKSTGHAPLFFPCDLTDISALQAAIQEAEAALGPIDVLVNNAANDERHKWEEVTPEYWDRMMDVNLRHQFFAIQAVAPGMKARGSGSIINLSSISWIIPGTGLPAYIAAKAAIVGLTRTMSRELGPSGVRVNCVLPGAILTEKQRRLWWTPDYEQKIMSSQCLKRHLMPEDVARLVLFLASDDSAAITGQSHIVDGGWV